MTDRLPIHMLDPAGATDGQVPTYDAAAGVVIWADGTSGGGATTLDGLTDVDTSTTPPTNGQALVYDSTDGLWKPATISSGGGGSGAPARIDDPADTLWAGSLGYDVEFETDGSSLPSGWSWFNQGTSTYAQRFGAGVIAPQNGSGVDGGQRGIVRALPTESAWTATVKISGHLEIKQWASQGLLLRDAVTGKYTTFAKRKGDVGRPLVASYNWSALEVFASVNWAERLGYETTQYLRVTRSSGGTYTYKASADGIAWATMASGVAAYATYNQIGLFVAAPGGAAANEHAFHWFRVR